MDASAAGADLEAASPSSAPLAGGLVHQWSPAPVSVKPDAPSPTLTTASDEPMMAQLGDDFGAAAVGMTAVVADTSLQATTPAPALDLTAEVATGQGAMTAAMAATTASADAELTTAQEGFEQPLGEAPLVEEAAAGTAAAYQEGDAGLTDGGTDFAARRGWPTGLRYSRCWRMARRAT